MSRAQVKDYQPILDSLQRKTFEYFVHESNPTNGLIADKTAREWPASITATGLALATYAVGAERGFMPRDEAAQRALTTLRFFANSPQTVEPDATGYKGFYYRFLDMQTGRRAWNCELSTIDTTFLLAGALVAAAYFSHDTEAEQEIRRLADVLYRRVDWRWVLNGGATVTHGWRPERGFLKHRWLGYNEALLLYVLGLGSPTYPLPEESYPAWCSSYVWKKIYGYDFLYAGPLFIHQLPQVWIDFRGIQDTFMAAQGIDYFENSRRATYVQREYAIRNPRQYAGYGEDCWGITASDGPGCNTLVIDGIKRHFFDYIARGVPYGPDDGTIAPWAALTSLPFAPEIVLPAIDYFDWLELRQGQPYGYRATFNPTYPSAAGKKYGWMSRYYFGLDQGPIALMIENYRSGLIWRLMSRSAYLVVGLRRAGFRGGWLAG
jgi:hypothetical protein